MLVEVSLGAHRRKDVRRHVVHGPLLAHSLEWVVGYELLALVVTLFHLVLFANF